MNFIRLTSCRLLACESVPNRIGQQRPKLYHLSCSCLFSSKPKQRGGEIIRVFDQSGKVIGNKNRLEAESIAKKNGFTLEPMPVLGKPKFPEYQLTNRHADNPQDMAEDLLAEDDKDQDFPSNPEIKRAKKPRELKRLNFDSSIAPGDLKVKITTINNWIAKDKEVHLVITLTGSTSSDTYASKICDLLTPDARIVQKRIKNRNLRIIIDRNPSLSDAHLTKAPDEDSEASESSLGRNRKSIADEFVIDPDLLSNDAELDKILNQNKKPKK